jgi:hypothetical protein
MFVLPVLSMAALVLYDSCIPRLASRRELLYFSSMRLLSLELTTQPKISSSPSPPVPTSSKQ